MEHASGSGVMLSVGEDGSLLLYSAFCYKAREEPCRKPCGPNMHAQMWNRQGLTFSNNCSSIWTVYNSSLNVFGDQMLLLLHLHGSL